MRREPRELAEDREERRQEIDRRQLVEEGVDPVEDADHASGYPLGSGFSLIPVLGVRVGNLKPRSG